MTQFFAAPALSIAAFLAGFISAVRAWRRSG